MDRFLNNCLLLAITICTFSNWISRILFGIKVSHVGNALIFAIFFICLLTGRTKKLRVNMSRWLIMAPVIMWVFGTFAALLFHSEIVLYLWAVRNYLRFFVLMYDCIMLFDRRILITLYKALNLALVAQIFVTLIQFIFLEIRWDYLNGIFGTEMGGNEGVHALLAIDMVVTLYLFNKKRIRWSYVVANFAAICGNAALNELKVVFVEVVVVVCLYLMVGVDHKKILEIAANRNLKLIITYALPIPIIVVLTVMLMNMVYPYTKGVMGVGLIGNLAVPHHDNLDSLSRRRQIVGVLSPMLEYARNVNPNLSNMCPVTGLGLGNAEFGTSEIFNSDFFRTYNWLWYKDFLQSILVIENGFLGMLLYDSIFVFLFIKNLVGAIRSKCRTGLFGTLYFALIIGVLFYDCSLRDNYGYLFWVTAGASEVILALEQEKKSVMDEDVLKEKERYA